MDLFWAVFSCGLFGDFFSILYLSLLKLPSIVIEIIPFVIVISTAFLYRGLISNNELISLRNIGYSILDIFKPIALAIFMIGLFIFIFLNPLSSISEKTFDSITTKDFSNMYSINIKNEDNFFYIAEKGSFDDKKFYLNDVIIFNINNDSYKKEKSKELSLNFDNQNLIDSISNYKHVPFYKYK